MFCFRPPGPPVIKRELLEKHRLDRFDYRRVALKHLEAKHSPFLLKPSDTTGSWAKTLSAHGSPDELEIISVRNAHDHFRLAGDFHRVTVTGNLMLCLDDHGTTGVQTWGTGEQSPQKGSIYTEKTDEPWEFGIQYPIFS
jgi:hypothetical protein